MYYKKIKFSKNQRNTFSKFLSFIDDNLIVCHNASFDHRFLNRELKYWGFSEIPIERFRCTLRMFKFIIPKVNLSFVESSKTLQKCCEYFGFVVNSRKYHNALFDAYMTYFLFIKLHKLLYKQKGEEIKVSNKIEFIDNANMTEKLFKELDILS